MSEQIEVELLELSKCLLILAHLLACKFVLRVSSELMAPRQLYLLYLKCEFRPYFSFYLPFWLRI